MTTPSPVEPPGAGRDTTLGDFLIGSVGTAAALISVLVIVGVLLADQLDYRAPHTVDTVSAAMGWVVATIFVTALVGIAGCFAVKGIQVTVEARRRTPRDDVRSGRSRDERGDMNLTPILLGALIIVVADANLAPLAVSYLRHHNFRQGFHQLLVGDTVLSAGFVAVVAAVAVGERRERNRLALEARPGPARAFTAADSESEGD
jgi:hypothetical protein